MKLKYLHDKALRTPCKLVTKDQHKEVLDTIIHMAPIMEKNNGIALAANQVGLDLRFFIMKLEDGNIDMFINPEIISMAEVAPFEEGCLSIPGASAMTTRARKVKLKFTDINFEEKEKEFSGMQAVAIQHEIDHLDGKLYIDNLDGKAKVEVMYLHKKYMDAKRRGLL